MILGPEVFEVLEEGGVVAAFDQKSIKVGRVFLDRLVEFSDVADEFWWEVEVLAVVERGCHGGERMKEFSWTSAISTAREITGS